MTDYPSPYSEPVLTAAPSPSPSPHPTPPPAQGSDDQSMKDKAADSAQAGKDAAGEVAQTAAEQAKHVAAESKDQARRVVGEARDQLQDHARTQHQNLVSHLGSLGDELSSMARNGDQQGPASELVAQAGERAHGVASWLDAREPAQLVDELRSFARRRPGAFVVGALVAGVLAGRLTRGVVAVHQSDDSSGSGSGDAPAAPPPPPPVPSSATEQLPAPGYGTPPPGIGTGPGPLQ